jgi:hypothetical protein
MTAMRLRRVQFSVRLMMVIIAATAVLLGVGVTLERRRARFQELAEFHIARSIHSIKWNRAKGYYDAKIGREGVPSANPEVDGRHEELAAKYCRAASYPWLPVEPDPVGYPP